MLGKHVRKLRNRSIMNTRVKRNISELECLIHRLPIKFEPLSPKDIASYKTRTSQELKVGGRVNPANIPLSRNSPTSKSRFDFSKSPALAVKFFFTHITTDL